MTRGARINARLSPTLAAKVGRLKMRTRKSTTDIVVEALDRYCAELGDEVRDPAEILERTGFIATASGPKDLSRRYKDHLATSLRKKT